MKTPTDSGIPSPCGLYLAPRLHLPSEGADLHQAGHRGCWFDHRVAVSPRHRALCAVDELDARHGPLSNAKVAGHRAGGRPPHFPSAQRHWLIQVLKFHHQNVTHTITSMFLNLSRESKLELLQTKKVSKLETAFSSCSFSENICLRL